MDEAGRPAPERMRSTEILVAAAFLLASAAFWLACCVRLWSWRACLAQETARCLPPVRASLAAAAWALPALALSVAGAWRLARALRARAAAISG